MERARLPVRRHAWNHPCPFIFTKRTYDPDDTVFLTDPAFEVTRNLYFLQSKYLLRTQKEPLPRLIMYLVFVYRLFVQHYHNNTEFLIKNPTYAPSIPHKYPTFRYYPLNQHIRLLLSLSNGQM